MEQILLEPIQTSLVDEYPDVLRPSEKNELMKVSQPGLERLRWGLLEGSCRDLLDERTSSATRAEILRWIVEDDYDYDFSFVNCVKSWGAIEGVAINPTEFRAKLMWRIRLHEKQMAKARQRSQEEVEAAEEVGEANTEIDEYVEDLPEDQVIQLFEDDGDADALFEEGEIEGLQELSFDFDAILEA